MEHRECVFEKEKLFPSVIALKTKYETLDQKKKERYSKLQDEKRVALEN